MLTNNTFSFKSTLLYCSIFLLSLSNIQAQQHSRKEVLTALNSHIDFIDSYAYKTRFSHRSFYNYYKSLIRSYKQQNYMMRFYHMPGKYPEKDSIAYEIAKSNIQYIPSQFRVQINTLIDSLRSIQKEQFRIAKALKKLTHPPQKDSVSIAKGFAGLKDLHDTAESYRKLSTDFYFLSKKISALYPLKTSSWSKTGALMQEALDTSRSYLHQVQLHLLNRAPLPNPEYLAALLLRMKAERNNVLSGLKEYGSYNGKDPHSKYDYIIRYLTNLKDHLSPDYKVRARSNLFNDVLYDFNWAISSYNKFAKLSADIDQTEPPAFLLKIPSQTLFFIHPPFDNVSQQTNLNKGPIQNKITAQTSMEGFAPNHLVFLLDVSGSMNNPSKLPLFKDAIAQIAPIMRTQDKFSVVVYSDNAKVTLNNVSFTDKEAINSLLTLSSKGKTNAFKGLQKAYSLAKKQFIINGNNRIIMVTDGDFDIPKKLYKAIESHTQKDIHLSVLAFGNRKTHFQEMKQMALLGKGNYTHVKNDNHIKTILKEIQVTKPKS